MRLNVSARTNAGRVRANNEDNLYINGVYKNDVDINEFSQSSEFEGDNFLFSVCDGMGGEAFGEIASLLAVKNLKAQKLENIQKNVTDDMNSINRVITLEGMARGGSSMGTTVASLYIDNNTAVACNVGDSRVYAYRAGKLFQLTKDHSQYQSLLNMGVSEDQISRKHGGNALTQYLGMNEEDIYIEPYFSGEIELTVGDRFLICSDGVTDMIDDNVLSSLMASDMDAKTLAAKIEETALQAGGKDNITIIVVDVEMCKMPGKGLPDKKIVSLCAIGIIAFIVLMFCLGEIRKYNSDATVSGNSIKQLEEDAETVSDNELDEDYAEKD